MFILKRGRQLLILHFQKNVKSWEIERAQKQCNDGHKDFALELTCKAE